MKKIFVGVMMLSLMASPVFAGGGGKKKAKKKAKMECCTKNCTDSKECPKTATCTPKPGCCMK